MKLVRNKNCVAIAVVQVLFVGAAYCADDLQQALDDANELARTRLVQYNQLDGIENVGGPFLLKDYTVTSKQGEVGWVDLHVEYRYRRPRGLEGEPDWFDIIVISAKDPWRVPKDPAPPEYFPYKKVGNF